MLSFDIDYDQLKFAADQIGASDKVFNAMIARACSRTAATLRKLSGSGLKNELQLRALGTLRKRLKSIRLRGAKNGVSLWYGLNDLPVSAFKGRPRNTKTGARKGAYEIEGGFVGKTKRGKATIFKRAGSARLPIREQLMEIKDTADIFIEDEIFTQVDRIFWQHFERDLKARDRYQKISDRWQ